MRRRWKITGCTAVSRCFFSVAFLHLASERKHADVQVLVCGELMHHSDPDRTVHHIVPYESDITPSTYLLVFTGRPESQAFKTLKLKMIVIIWETLLGIAKPEYFP